MDIIQAIEDDRYFRPWLRDLKSWQSWLTFLRVLFALPIEGKTSKKLYRSCTGRDSYPTQRAKEAYIISGRRSGKSSVCSLLSCWLACFKDWKPYLRAGEKGYIFLLAVDQLQAKVERDYISGILHSTPVLSAYIESETETEIRLKNNIVIMVKAADFRGIRGRTILAAICSELSFWYSEETSANPAHEILRALRPSMLTVPESLLICISTAYAESGPMYDFYREFWGLSSGPLIWRSTTEQMNPTIDKGEIKRALKDDYIAARSEYFSEFRSDVSSYLPLSAIDVVSIPGRFELRPNPQRSYYGFIDMSGGSGKDSSALAIAHYENQKAILDCVRETVPPFKPSSCVSDFASTLSSYGITQVIADRYGGDWIKEAFEKHGIFVEKAEMTASQYYLAFIPLVMNQSVELLSHEKLKSQLVGLQRFAKGGADKVTHRASGHDDVSNVVSAVCVLASKADQDFPLKQSFGYTEADLPPDPNADIQLESGEIVPRSIYDWLCPDPDAKAKRKAFEERMKKDEDEY